MPGTEVDTGNTQVRQNRPDPQMLRKTGRHAISVVTSTTKDNMVL